MLYHSASHVFSYCLDEIYFKIFSGLKTRSCYWMMSLQLNILTQLYQSMEACPPPWTIDYMPRTGKTYIMTSLFKVPCLGHTVLFLYHFPFSSLQHSHGSGTETVQRLLLDWKERGRERVIESERKIMCSKFQTIECSSSLLTIQGLIRQWGFIMGVYIVTKGKKTKRVRPEHYVWWVGLEVLHQPESTVMSVAKNVLYQQTHLRVDWNIKKEQLEQMLDFFLSTIPVIFSFLHTISYFLCAFLASTNINLCLL